MNTSISSNANFTMQTEYNKIHQLGSVHWSALTATAYTAYTAGVWGAGCGSQSTPHTHGCFEDSFAQGLGVEGGGSGGLWLLLLKLCLERNCTMETKSDRGASACGVRSADGKQVHFGGFFGLLLFLVSFDQSVYYFQNAIQRCFQGKHLNFCEKNTILCCCKSLTFQLLTPGETVVFLRRIQLQVVPWGQTLHDSSYYSRADWVLAFLCCQETQVLTPACQGVALRSLPPHHSVCFFVRTSGAFHLILSPILNGLSIF